jgi:hypothetical protein
MKVKSSAEKEKEGKTFDINTRKIGHRADQDRMLRRLELIGQL